MPLDPSSTPKPRRRVAVLVGSSLTWREEVMRGIAGYANAHGRWHVYTAPEGVEDAVFFTGKYRWDGLIVRPASLRFVRRVLALGVPAVAIGSVRVPSVRLPRVKVDDDELTRTALRHLIGGGLRQFAYCSFLPTKAAEDRGPAFARAAAEAGHACTFYADAARAGAAKTWQSRQRDLVRWVRQLPKPVGVLCWNPDVACQLVEACHAAGVAVPADVAVVSADDDTAKCELTAPTISATPIPAARIGHEAAKLLDHLMAGGAAPAEPVLVPPAGVVTVRESSDTATLADRDVYQAVQYIRDHAARAITVADVARAQNVSRRSLERHFRRALGCTPHDRLHQERMATARRLLLETDWPAARIAGACGLASPAHLIRAFRDATGLTPIAFRRQHRPA